MAGGNQVSEIRVRDIPLLEQEGWLRHKSNIAKPPNCRRRGGQVGLDFQA